MVTVKRKEYYLKMTPERAFVWFIEPSFLESWFASKVTCRDNSYTFFWNDIKLSAELVDKKRNSMLRFKWLQNPASSFEVHFHPTISNNGMFLEIIDTISHDSLIDNDLWDIHIANLKEALRV
jgi:hypothetical protein